MSRCRLSLENANPPASNGMFTDEKSHKSKSDGNQRDVKDSRVIHIVEEGEDESKEMAIKEKLKGVKEGQFCLS